MNSNEQKKHVATTNRFKVFAISQPESVGITEMTILPTKQA